MKRLFFLTLLVSSVFVSWVNSLIVYRNIEVFSIEDKKLEPILDSIIAIDKTREYYSPDLQFDISFGGDSIIQIEAIYSLYADPDGSYPTSKFGAFEYQGHSFFISGVYYDRRILRPTGKKKSYKCYNRDYEYEKGKTYIYVLRDGYNIWRYRYTSDGSFELIKFSDTSKPPRPVTYPARLMHLPTFNISYPAKVEKINFGPIAK